ncbi:MAG: DMT family transporter [Ruminococcaceae bacterium]|nr:DMT family transporter [Oscillospiraceae bacterium]
MEKSAKNNLKGSLLLCIAAMIWGFAFVAQTDAGSKIPLFTFNGMRAFIAAVFLFVVGSIIKFGDGTKFLPADKTDCKKMFKAGIICGVLLFVATNLQQFGLTVYPEGVAAEARGGFLTALYIIIVPVLSLFMKKKPGIVVWIAVVLAIAGTYLLCIGAGQGGFHLGDIMLILCAAGFSVHIMAISKFGDGVNGIKLSAIQFLVCGVLSLVPALAFESTNFQTLLSAMPQILYVGILSSGVAYTLQIIGQKYAEPSVATLSMSLESVFAALGGWLISGNSLGAKELIGCAFVFVAVLVAQIKAD